MSMASFAIVGAGVSGICLARKLAKVGHHCTVFEKSRGIGGRLTTRQQLDWQADLGAQYFTARHPRFKKEVERWQQAGWIQEWPLHPWVLSQDGFEKVSHNPVRYVGVPKMNAMLHGLSKDLTVCLNTQIIDLETEHQKWRLLDQNGQSHGGFDAVILAIPANQSLTLLPRESPLKHSPLQDFMRPVWAVALSFETATGIVANGVFVNEGNISWVAKDSSKPDRPQRYETWVVHFTSEWTENNLNVDSYRLTRDALKLLSRLAKKSLPEYHEVYQHRWLYAKSNPTLTQFPQWHSGSRLGLVGDWVMSGRFEDAWLSADKLARTLLSEFS